MPGSTGMLRPQTPSRTQASRLGVRADSSSVSPPGSRGKPPRPSATSRTIFVPLSSFSSRVRSCMSMREVYPGGGTPYSRPGLDFPHRQDIPTMSRLTNKVALVTGGGSGIGLAVARAFLDEGARVAVTGRDVEKLRRAADSLRAGDRVTHHAADVADPRQVQTLVRHVVGRFGPVDVL